MLHGQSEDDYVMPKNEYDCYKELKYFAEANGVDVYRIENVGISLPDEVWIFKGLTIWNEIKVIRRHRIQIRVNAHAVMIRMSHRLKPFMLNYICWDESSQLYRVYNFDDVAKTGTIETSGRPGIGWIPLLGIKYQFQFSNKEECKQYIEQTLDLAYPSRVKQREALKQQAMKDVNNVRFSE